MCNRRLRLHWVLFSMTEGSLTVKFYMTFIRLHFHEKHLGESLRVRGKRRPWWLDVKDLFFFFFWPSRYSLWVVVIVVFIIKIWLLFPLFWWRFHTVHAGYRTGNGHLLRSKHFSDRHNLFFTSHILLKHTPGKFNVTVISFIARLNFTLIEDFLISQMIRFISS